MLGGGDLMKYPVTQSTRTLNTVTQCHIRVAAS